MDDLVTAELLRQGFALTDPEQLPAAADGWSATVITRSVGGSHLNIGCHDGVTFYTER